MTLTEAERATEAVKGECDRERIDGVEHWLSPGIGGGRPRKAPLAFLLPPFDEYTVAYADRAAVVDRDRLSAAGHGIGPNLIIDGRLAGQWKRTLKRHTVFIELNPLRPLTREEKVLVPGAVEPYARFLGLSPAIAGIG